MKARLLALLLLFPAAVAAEDAWERLSTFDFNALDAVFTGAERPLGRSDRLAWAIARLNRQPRTDGQVEAAAELLQKIIEENSGDDAGLWAIFELGRIEEHHRSPARPLEAARLYRALLAARPDHPAAARARAKLAVLLLYEPAVEPSREKGFAAAQALLDGVADRQLLGELHALIGRAAVFFRWPPGMALPHLEAALESGVATAPLRRSLLMTTAEMADREGRRELALLCLRRFADEFRRDPRINYVRARIALLQAGTAAGEGGEP